MRILRYAVFTTGERGGKDRCDRHCVRRALAALDGPSETQADAAHLRICRRPWHRYLGGRTLSKLFQETDGLGGWTRRGRRAPCCRAASVATSELHSCLCSKRMPVLGASSTISAAPGAAGDVAGGLPELLAACSAGPLAVDRERRRKLCNSGLRVDKISNVFGLKAAPKQGSKSSSASSAPSAAALGGYQVEEWPDTRPVACGVAGPADLYQRRWMDSSTISGVVGC
jgi:hypothetical protein